LQNNYPMPNDDDKLVVLLVDDSLLIVDKVLGLLQELENIRIIFQDAYGLTQLSLSPTFRPYKIWSHTARMRLAYPIWAIGMQNYGESLVMLAESRHPPKEQVPNRHTPGTFKADVE